VLRDGIDEKAKITAAHATTGSQELATERGDEPSFCREFMSRSRIDIRSMVGSGPRTELGEGTRCESGTVPPL
jgi:hypothetical protein